MKMIEINNLYLSFKDKVIFEDFSLQIEKTDKLGIKGESGKGKTTLLNLLMGFINPQKGSILFEGSLFNPTLIKALRTKTAYLPQNVVLFSDGTVSEAIDYPFHFQINKRLKPKRNTIIEELEKVNLKEEILNTSVTKISGGEKQRIGLVIAKLLNREILLLDEPTASLDENSRNAVISSALNSKSTIISVSHDIFWLNKCSKIIEL